MNVMMQMNVSLPQNSSSTQCNNSRMLLWRESCEPHIYHWRTDSEQIYTRLPITFRIRRASLVLSWCYRLPYHAAQSQTRRSNYQPGITGTWHCGPNGKEKTEKECVVLQSQRETLEQLLISRESADWSNGLHNRHKHNLHLWSCSSNNRSPPPRSQQHN